MRPCRRRSLVERPRSAALGPGAQRRRAGGGLACALLARVPDLDQSLVIIALADDSERRIDLAASMLRLVTLPSG